ncbi:family 43 glycosylhydrolase [Kibdelosporangium aridum]|uniref:family 43 glycosylhydrolase n=1 Tax=Kibdelosporangium aridum TaxID=2030 RepID=UPI0035F00DCE
MARRWLALSTSGLLLCGLTSAIGTPVAAAAATYANPVTNGVVDTFPDPVTIRGKDGLWYAYGTQNPVFQSKGEDGERMLPILRSADLVTWQYAGQVFTPQTQPAWHNGSRLWAPDIRYVGNRYHLYYSVPGRNTVGLATSPTPTGPWSDAGAVLPTPSGCPTGNIDQALFTDTGGAHYLYWGSYDTVCVARMNASATRIEGPVTQVARGRRMEGAFVVKRDGFYYLFYSDAGCCDGAFSGYQVKAGRATNPLGPFTDDEGVDLMALTSKGGVVAGATGNRWIGPGHNGLQTDLSGQDWLVYHGIPADNPDLAPASGGTLKLTRRPMLIDRLDWINGWPVLPAGAGPSEGAQPAPVTTPVAGSTFNDRSISGMRADGVARTGWSAAQGHLSHEGGGPEPAYLATETKASADVRAEADLRITAGSGAVGLLVNFVDRRNHVVIWLDRSRNALISRAVVDGRTRSETVTALPAGFRFEDWHNVAAEVRGSRMVVEVSADRLRDSVATQEVELLDTRLGAVGVAARGGQVDADNLSAAPLYQPVTTRLPQPSPGELLPQYTDEFNGTSVPGTEPGSPWRWVRGPATGTTMVDGTLSWPTQNAELHLGSNTASVLLRDAPPGDYTIETRIRFAPESAAQQAGILLYENDDRYFKLVHSVLPLNRGGGALVHVSEFSKEGERPTTTPPTPVANAPMFGGPTATTMWLRLAYHADTAGRQAEVQAFTSRDGTHWVANSVWTLPALGTLKIGLVSMNRAGAEARFDYLRTYRP